VIQDHSDHSTSKKPTNPLWSRIRRFVWYTMTRVVLDHWSWSRSKERILKFQHPLQTLQGDSFQMKLTTEQRLQTWIPSGSSPRLINRSLVIAQYRHYWTYICITLKRLLFEEYINTSFFGTLKMCFNQELLFAKDFSCQLEIWKMYWLLRSERNILRITKIPTAPVDPTKWLSSNKINDCLTSTNLHSFW